MSSSPEGASSCPQGSARYTVLNGVATDLFPQRTGPKKATKRTRELEVRVIQMRFDTTCNMYEIADELNRLGFDISARLVGKILSDFGLSKKNLVSSCKLAASVARAGKNFSFRWR